MLAQSDLDLGSADDKDLSIVTRPVWLARVWVDPLAVWLCGPGRYSRMGGSQKGLETAVWTQFTVHTLPWGVWVHAAGQVAIGLMFPWQGNMLAWCRVPGVYRWS